MVCRLIEHAQSISNTVNLANLAISIDIAAKLQINNAKVNVANIISDTCALQGRREREQQSGANFPQLRFDLSQTFAQQLSQIAAEKSEMEKCKKKE